MTAHPTDMAFEFDPAAFLRSVIDTDRVAAGDIDAAVTFARNVNPPGAEPDAAVTLASILVRANNIVRDYGSDNEVGYLLFLLADGIARRILLVRRVTQTATSSNGRESCSGDGRARRWRVSISGARCVQSRFAETVATVAIPQPANARLHGLQSGAD